VLMEGEFPITHVAVALTFGLGVTAAAEMPVNYAVVPLTAPGATPGT